MNWLIIDGLKRYGFSQEANILTEKTIALVNEHGPYEYFSALHGNPLGASEFSWTAALTVDLLAD
jgi:glycogen debranching enzyme